MSDWLPFLKIPLVFIPLGLIPVMIFLERKGAALIQDRIGPNRAAIPILGGLRGFGMVHNFSDVVKLLFKEDFIPRRAHRLFYILAPVLPVATAVLTPAVIPWFAPLSLDGRSISGQVIDSDAGLLFLFAISSLSAYGVVLGSWASNSKYSLLGGMRASAMLISYEISMGLSVLGLLMIVGSFGLTDIVEWQAHNAWGLVVQPVGFLLFVVAIFAETGRTPFDVVEGESEIVGGFHTEYSSIKFALYFMGEYAHIVVGSALIATLFCGGYHLPFLDTDTIRAHLGPVLGLGALLKAGLLGLLLLALTRYRRHYRAGPFADKAQRSREYGFYQALLSLGALSLGAAGLAAILLLDIPAASPWAAGLTALVQLGIVLVKTLFFCWLFIWVRWTLPRLRYDQIMSLGWKVLLNIALINLLITALVLKLIAD